MKFKTENIISFMIAIALLVISLYNFIIKKENSSFINIIIAILFIIFELIRVKYNKKMCIRDRIYLIQIIYYHIRFKKSECSFFICFK